MQVDQLAAIADPQAQVEERLAAMRAFVTSQQHGPNGLIVEDGRDLLQCDDD
jgi:hypothetical protein